MSSFNQGVPGPATLINSSNCIVYGNTTSGTALTVQQLGAGAVMNVATSTGSSALFVSSTGQVGIGQTAPQTLLHVTATAANSAIFIDNSITGGATPYNTVRPSASGAGSANCHIWSDGNAVGTSDAGFLRIAAGGGTAGITKSYIDLSGYSTVTDMNQNIVFGTSGSEKMRITSGGNVGIGLTNPGAQLTLTSNLYAGGMIQSAGATGGITNQGAYMAWNLSTARGETDFINQQGLGSGGWNWYSYNSSNQLTSNAAYLSSTGGLTLGTYSNAYTAPSGGLICPGNVGIGVTNPGYVLQVNSAATGSETVAAFLKPSMATGGTFAGIQVGGAIATGGAGAMGFLNYGTNASNVFQLSLNGSGGSAININSTGVGIGTTNPSYLLDVNGQSRIGNPVLITDASTTLRMTTSGGVAYFQAGTALTAYSVADIVFTGIFGTPEFMRIKSTGNVGIGTTNPGYQLDLSTDGARKLTSTTWLTGSDQRIKTDIQSANLQMCYDTVKSIDLKYFKWNFPTDSNVVPDDKHSLGFIAQEVKTVFPNAVSESNSYGYSDFLSLNTDQILKAMYGALKQTMADKEALEQSLSSLEQRLAAAGL